ncbi:MAG: pyridoxal 5'-phosphate synthase glutaminase subunit PdxT [Bacteroidaceae bacterium]|nr:pyridoxal 5'-phosphate synthase glutaminase subunit PdxT [Bacteroidaceae bacterium]
MRIGVLALQGAFVEHEQVLRRLGAEVFEIRSLGDWLRPKDGLVLPGGESTVQGRLLRQTGLFEPMRREIAAGLPTLGTCAGLILLSPLHFGTMSMQVRRNAYGRQLGSFHTLGSVKGVGEDVPMTFIRAPYIESLLSPQAEALAWVGGRIVAARQGRQLVTAFHPELDNDLRLHSHFLATL